MINHIPHEVHRYRSDKKSQVNNIDYINYVLLTVYD